MQFLFLLNLARKLQRRVPAGFLKASHLQGGYADSRKPHGALSTPTTKTSHNKKYVLTRGLLVASIMTMTACHSIQRVERPAFDVPQEVQNAAAEIVPSVEIEKDWWASFQSPQLNQLIELAHQQNPDLRIAAERVRQAELQMRIAGASLFPSFNISGSTGSGRSRFDGGEWQKNESSRLGLGASYEVDLWGRVSADINAARANFNASQYDQVASELSINGAVANAWFQWLVLQQRIATAQENLRIAERTSQIVEARYRNGVATASEVSRQRTNLLSQQSSLIPLQLQARQSRAALALLVGESSLNFVLPNENAEQLMSLNVPEISAGIPADLLTRRPDLASAEAQLQASDANVAAARAALLPSVQLTGSASRGSPFLFSLAQPTDTLSWSLSLAQTLFSAGRIRNQVALSESQRVTLVERYRANILTAVQEVNDALDRRAVAAELEQRQMEVLKEAERTLQLVEARYREGRDDLLSLLDAQRTVFQARDQLAQQRLDRLRAAVDLYLALGGGWSLNESLE